MTDQQKRELAKSIGEFMAPLLKQRLRGEYTVEELMELYKAAHGERARALGANKGRVRCLIASEPYDHNFWPMGPEVWRWGLQMRPGHLTCGGRASDRPTTEIGEKDQHQQERLSKDGLY